MTQTSKKHIKRLFFDIETSYCTGWFWRPAFKTSISYDQILNNSAIICICYKWQGEGKVHHLQWNKGDDKEMINKFVKVLLEADEVIGHNSDKFDLKWIRTRCLVSGYKSLPDFKSIDTLKISRAKFLLPSNRLDAIGKYLGFGGKKDTGGIQLWHDVIQKNSKIAMAKMISYCKRDVELLEKVYLKLQGYNKAKTHIGVLLGNEKCSCPSCGSKHYQSRGTAIAATGLKKRRLQCQDCGHWYSVSDKAYENRNK